MDLGARGPRRPAREALAAWGGAVMLGGFFESWVALVGLAMMVVGAPWPRGARGRRRALERLRDAYPEHAWDQMDEELVQGLAPVHRSFSSVWALPMPAGRCGRFDWLAGGTPRCSSDGRLGLGLALGPPARPGRCGGHLERLGRLTARDRLGALAPGDRLRLADGWLTLETSRAAGAERWGRWLRVARARLLGERDVPPREIVAWLRAASAPELRLATVLAYPEVFERRPDPDDLVAPLEAVAGDTEAPRSTRLRAVRVLAGRIPAPRVLELMDRLVFLRGARPDPDVQDRLLHLLDARDLDAQVAAARALEPLADPRALGPLAQAQPADLRRAAELSEAIAHTRAAIRARAPTAPSRGSLAVMPEAGGALGLVCAEDGAASASD